VNQIPSSRDPADEGTSALPDARFTEMILQFARQSSPELRPYALAWAEVGYVVTPSNESMYTQADVAAFSESVARYRELLNS